MLSIDRLKIIQVSKVHFPRLPVFNTSIEFNENII